MAIKIRAAQKRAKLRAGLLALSVGILPTYAQPSALSPAQAAPLSNLANPSSKAGFDAVPEIEKLRVAIDRVSDEVLQRTRYVGRDGKTVTSDQIATFLSAYRSPMAPHAQEIVRAGNMYSVDPKLIVAIAGVESTFGHRCRGFNAWGWNGGRTRWSSWSESISEYTRLLSENYPHNHNIRRVARTYNPNTPEAWGRKVGYLMASIEGLTSDGPAAG